MNLHGFAFKSLCIAKKGIMRSLISSPVPLYVKKASFTDVDKVLAL